MAANGKHKTKRRWTLAARKRLSAALKASWGLRKKAETGIVHTTPATPMPKKVTIPQGVRDMDSIVQRFDRLDRVGQQFLIGQLTKMFCKSWGEGIQ